MILDEPEIGGIGAKPFDNLHLEFGLRVWSFSDQGECAIRIGLRVLNVCCWTAIILRDVIRGEDVEG